MPVSYWSLERSALNLAHYHKNLPNSFKTEQIGKLRFVEVTIKDSLILTALMSSNSGPEPISFIE